MKGGGLRRVPEQRVGSKSIFSSEQTWALGGTGKGV